MNHYYEFKVDTDIIDDLIKTLPSYTRIENVSNTTISTGKDKAIQTLFHEKLFDRLEECLEEIRKKEYSDSMKLVIVESWATETVNFQKHHKHIHPNSLLSGILYLTDHPDATTNLYIPNPFSFLEAAFPMIQPSRKELVIRVKPEKGKVIIFPSNTYHDTSLTLNSSKPRLTFAFNAFPHGTIGHLGGGPSRLILRPVSVREYVKREETGTLPVVQKQNNI